MESSSSPNLYGPNISVDQVASDQVIDELSLEFKNTAKSVATLYNGTIQKNKTNNDNKIEFANAAKSLASLYRKAISSNSLMHDKGYLDCLKDILEVMKHGGNAETWALMKLSDMSSMNHDTHPEPISSGSPVQQAFSIPETYQFSVTSNINPPQSFKPGIPPLSVVHSSKQRNNLKHVKPDSHLRYSVKHPKSASYGSDDHMCISDDNESDPEAIDKLNSFRQKRKHFEREYYRNKKAHLD